MLPVNCPDRFNVLPLIVVPLKDCVLTTEENIALFPVSCPERFSVFPDIEVPDITEELIVLDEEVFIIAELPLIVVPEITDELTTKENIALLPVNCPDRFSVLPLIVVPEITDAFNVFNIVEEPLTI